MSAHGDSDDEQQPFAFAGAAAGAGNQAALAQIYQALLFRSRPAASSNAELVRGLKRSGIIEEPLERAFLLFDRKAFVPEENQDEAYEDQPIRMERFGVNVSAPHMHGQCLQSLELDPGMKFLDVGSGCGLLTAVAAHVCGHALGIDIRDDIVEFGEGNVRRWREAHPDTPCPATFARRNVFLLDPADETFDRIHVGASCPREKVKALQELLRPGGVLVTPCGCELLRIRKDAAGRPLAPSVRYGDLQVPTAVEVMAARFASERKSALAMPEVPGSLGEDLRKLAGTPRRRPRPAAMETEEGAGAGRGREEPEPGSAGRSLRRRISAGSEASDGEEESEREVFIACRGRRFRSLRGLLGARSEWFAALWRHRRASVASPNGKGGAGAPGGGGGTGGAEGSTVALDELDPEAVKCCLEHITTDSVACVSDENVVQLLVAANFLQLPRLKRACEILLRANVDDENAVSVLEVAEHASAVQLKRVCLDYIVQRFEAVSRTPAFRHLDPDLATQVTAEACGQLRRAMRIVSDGAGVPLPMLPAPASTPEGDPDPSPPSARRDTL
eukprot:tig00021432_g21191.t1